MFSCHIQSAIIEDVFVPVTSVADPAVDLHLEERFFAFLLLCVVNALFARF